MTIEMKDKFVNIAAYAATPILTALIIAAMTVNCCSDNGLPVQEEPNTYTKDSIIVRTPVGHLRKGQYTYALFPGEIFIGGHHHPVLKAGDTIGIRLDKDCYLELSPDKPVVTKFITNTGEEIEQ